MRTRTTLPRVCMRSLSIWIQRRSVRRPRSKLHLFSRSGATWTSLRSSELTNGCFKSKKRFGNDTAVVSERSQCVSASTPQSSFCMISLRHFEMWVLQQRVKRNCCTISNRSTTRCWLPSLTTARGMKASSDSNFIPTLILIIANKYAEPGRLASQRLLKRRPNQLTRYNGPSWSSSV